MAHVNYAKQLLQVYQLQKYAQDAIDRYATSAFAVAPPSPKRRSALSEITEVPEEEEGEKEGGEEEKTEKPSRTPLVILGASGSGKSSALAWWLTTNRRPGFVLPHFIGSSHNSTDHIEITRRILEELQRAFKLEGDVPNSPDGVIELLPLWLYRACEVRAPFLMHNPAHIPYRRAGGCRGWQLGAVVVVDTSHP